MLGADIVPDPVGRASTLPVAPAIRARLPAVAPAGAADDSLAPPRRWPLDESGFLTRGQVTDSAREENHPGLDIAVPVGSLVRASAAGTVLRRGRIPNTARSSCYSIATVTRQCTVTCPESWWIPAQPFSRETPSASPATAGAPAPHTSTSKFAAKAYHSIR